MINPPQRRVVGVVTDAREMMERYTPVMKMILRQVVVKVVMIEVERDTETARERRARRREKPERRNSKQRNSNRQKVLASSRGARSRVKLSSTVTVLILMREVAR